MTTIAELGYKGSTMAEIARRAGVSKGVIHYYFRSKQELFLTVLQKMVDDVISGCDRLYEELHAEDALTRLNTAIDYGIDLIKMSPLYYKIILEFWGETTRSSVFQRVNAEFYRRYRDYLAEIVRQGIDEGTFRQVSSDELASLITGVSDGLCLQWMFEEESFDFERARRMLKQMVLAYLSPSSNAG
jgi:AcrR family transcriptional regulator